MKDAIARFILVRIENHQRKNHLGIQFKETTLEHICPKTPTAWNLPADVLERHPQFVNRIGNLTLLKGSGNSELGNKKFDEKVKFYKNEKLKINKDVVELDEWDEESIASRQEELAKVALVVWPKR